MNKHAVLNLWRFTVRPLGLIASERSPFIMHLASKVSTEKEAVALIKLRFTSAWWDGMLIQEVDRAGQLHMIEDVPLYEGSDT